MKVSGLVLSLGLLAGTVLLERGHAATQPPDTAVRVLVTAEPKGNAHGELPKLSTPDVQVYQGKQRDRVTAVEPLDNDSSPLQLLVLLDDGAGVSLNTQLNDLRQFINEQSRATQVAVAYMQNGIARTAAEFSADHAAVAKAVRVPLGQPGVNGSPYFSLRDAIKKWPAGPGRREVLMISDGIDRYGSGTGLDNPYVNDAISDAQKAGVVVFAIYTSAADHYGHSYWRTNLGQNYLSQVADQTGGECYWFGPGDPVSFRPYLEQINERFRRQYYVSFLTQPQQKAGWQAIKMTTELPHVDLVHPDRVWVRAGY